MSRSFPGRVKSPIKCTGRHCAEHTPVRTYNPYDSMRPVRLTWSNHSSGTAIDQRGYWTCTGCGYTWTAFVDACPVCVR